MAPRKVLILGLGPVSVVDRDLCNPHEPSSPPLIPTRIWESEILRYVQVNPFRGSEKPRGWSLFFTATGAEEVEIGHILLWASYCRGGVSAVARRNTNAVKGAFACIPLFAR